MFNPLFCKIETLIKDENVSIIKLQEFEDWLSVFLEPVFEDDGTAQRARKIIEQIEKIKESRKPQIEKDVLSFFG